MSLEATFKGTSLSVIVVVHFGVSEWEFGPKGMFSALVGDQISHKSV